MSASKEYCVPPLRSALFRISKGLSDREVEEMKFLCRDLITESEMETVKAGFELFGILCKHQQITETKLGLVVDLLDHIQRDDLKKIIQEIGPVQERRSSAPGNPTAFAVLKSPADFGTFSTNCHSASPQAPAVFFDEIPEFVQQTSERSEFPGVYRRRQTQSSSMSHSQSFPHFSSPDSSTDC